eukprot:s2586_g11.t1
MYVAKADVLITHSSTRQDQTCSRSHLKLSPPSSPDPLLIPASSLERLELQAADPPWPLELRPPWLQGPNGMAHRPSGGSSPSKSRLSRDADATPTRISPSPKLLTLGGGGRSPSASPIGTERFPLLPLTLQIPFGAPGHRCPLSGLRLTSATEAASRDALPCGQASGAGCFGTDSFHFQLAGRVSAGTAAKETSGIPHEILARGDRAQRKFREALAKGKAQPRREPHDLGKFWSHCHSQTRTCRSDRSDMP